MVLTLKDERLASIANLKRDVSQYLEWFARHDQSPSEVEDRFNSYKILPSLNWIICCKEYLDMMRAASSRDTSCRSTVQPGISNPLFTTYTRPSCLRTFRYSASKYDSYDVVFFRLGLTRSFSAR